MKLIENFLKTQQVRLIIKINGSITKCQIQSRYCFILKNPVVCAIIIPNKTPKLKKIIIF